MNLFLKPVDSILSKSGTSLLFASLRNIIGVIGINSSWSSDKYVNGREFINCSQSRWSHTKCKSQVKNGKVSEIDRPIQRLYMLESLVDNIKGLVEQKDFGNTVKNQTETTTTPSEVMPTTENEDMPTTSSEEEKITKSGSSKEIQVTKSGTSEEVQMTRSGSSEEVQVTRRAVEK